mmetsp:Transcript_46060/g.85945  ORF Transcript_46060/g.85945 Transcript_46060/m.85945 type:complete len:89 (+) Transcript_46060:677-943(+)
MIYKTQCCCRSRCGASGVFMETRGYFATRCAKCLVRQWNTSREEAPEPDTSSLPGNSLLADKTGLDFGGLWIWRMTPGTFASRLCTGL